MTARVRKEGGQYKLEGDQPLEEANAFLNALSLRGLSPATVRSYAYDLLTLDRWLTESRQQIAGLDQAQLLDFIAYQRRACAKPHSINRRLITCALFYRFVTGKELPSAARASAPGVHYKGQGRERELGLHSLQKRSRLRLRVKAPYKVVRPLTAPQVNTFIGTLRRYRDLAIVYLMLFLGLRSCELLSLRLSDIDAKDHRVRVQGKGNRERVLPVPSILLSVLSDYVRLERPSGSATDHLFVVLQGPRRGHPMSPSGLRNLFRQRRRTRGAIRNANAHRFRHTFGRDMACAGVRLPILQQMMGHADSKTTLLYINLSMADIAREYLRALEAIEKYYE